MNPYENEKKCRKEVFLLIILAVSMFFNTFLVYELFKEKHTHLEIENELIQKLERR